MLYVPLGVWRAATKSLLPHRQRNELSIKAFGNKTTSTTRTHATVSGFVNTPLAAEPGTKGDICCSTREQLIA